MGRRRRRRTTRFSLKCSFFYLHILRNACRHASGVSVFEQQTDNSWLPRAIRMSSIFRNLFCTAIERVQHNGRRPADETLARRRPRHNPFAISTKLAQKLTLPVLVRLVAEPLFPQHVFTAILIRPLPWCVRPAGARKSRTGAVHREMHENRVHVWTESSRN